MSILIPIAVVGGLGGAYGIALAIASKVFHVEVDPKIELINDALPAANCGACGLPGCAAYAEAIVENGEAINKCAPGGDDVIAAIAKIMGTQAITADRKVAVIHCQSGGTNNTFLRYEYKGIETCKAAVTLDGGPNVCTHGCVGYNDCIDVCLFDAISLDENNMRIIDNAKCTGCGACERACPRQLIRMIPEKMDVHIMCQSHDKGGVAKKACGNTTACIGCTLCVRNCPKDAITMVDNCAVIDYDKCINCGICYLGKGDKFKGCPTGAITHRRGEELKAKRVAKSADKP